MRGPSRRLWLGSALVVAVVVAVAALVAMVDGRALVDGLRRATGDPVGLALVMGALLVAFVARARAWCLLVPDLTLGSALAGIHLTLGANHVLPLRLGEPLRVVSVVRRAGINPVEATSTTVALRAADLVSLILAGLVAGPAVVARTLGWGWALAVGGAAVIVGGAAVLVNHGRGPASGEVGAVVARRSPGTVALAGALSAGAWLAEAVVVGLVARWFGVPLGVAGAVAVLAVAVSAQVVAVTPGGIGTYEAAATAAVVAAAGVPVGTAAALAVGLHGVKTLYSLLAGAVALVVPDPGLAGRLRLPPAADIPRRLPPAGPAPTGADPVGPVVLFLPARNEAPRVGAVIEAAPTMVADHPVEVVVVDDGSDDDTATVARSAGATVVTHPTPRGLGAAVRTGLAHGAGRGAVAVAFCDADGEYDPAELERLVAPIVDGRADYVVGSRFAGTIGHMRPHRRLGNRLLTLLVARITRAPVSDGQSGYRALSGPAAAQAHVAHDYNYAQVLTVDLLARGALYHEVPITYSFRRSGRSFVRLGPYLSRVVPTLWRQLNSLEAIPCTSHQPHTVAPGPAAHRASGPGPSVWP